MAHNKTTEPLIANVVILFMQVFFFKKRFYIYILNEKKKRNKMIRFVITHLINFHKAH